MSAQQQPTNKPSPAGSITSSDHAGADSKTGTGKDVRDVVPPTAPALATQQTQRMEAALGDAILRFLRIRKGPKAEEYDLDAVGCLRGTSICGLLADQQHQRLLHNLASGTPRIWKSTRRLTSTHNGRTRRLLTPHSAGLGEKRDRCDGRLIGRLWSVLASIAQCLW